MGSEESKLMSQHMEMMLNDPNYGKVDMDLLSGDKTATIADCHTSEYHKKVSKLFAILDKDSNGFIEGTELPDLAKALAKVHKKQTGKSLQNEFVVSIISANDFDCNNKIDYKEFSGIMDDIYEEIKSEK